MSRKVTYLVTVIAVMTVVVGCSSGSSGASALGTGSQTQQVATTQQSAVAALQSPGSTQQPGSQAPQACAVLSKDRVGTEFGATFPDGTVGSTVPPLSATASSTCRFHTNTAAGNPWTITVYVFGFASDAAASAQMTEYRRTTTTTGTLNWAIVERPGLGDDAIFHNLLSLHDTQEEVIVRKGNAIYWLLDTIITGISDVTAARNHLVALATLAISR